MELSGKDWAVLGFQCLHIVTVRALLQPVSYISLALTLGTGGGLLWYYSQLQGKKMSGEPCAQVLL